MSFGNIVLKLALREVFPITMIWLPTAIGIATMCIYTFVIQGETFPAHLDLRTWGYLAAIGLGNFVVAPIGFTLALERLPVTTHNYLSNFVGFVTMALSVVILKETPTRFQLIGSAVALVGMRRYFSSVPPAYELAGFGLVAIGVLAIAGTNNMTRKLAIVTTWSVSNNVFSTIVLVIGGGMMVMIGLGLDWPPRVKSLQNWFYISFYGVVIIGVAFTVWNHSLRTLRSYEASILGASTIIWTALLAAAMLGDQLGIAQLIGIALMLLGVSLVQIRRFSFGRLRHEHEIETNDASGTIPGKFWGLVCSPNS